MNYRIHAAMLCLAARATCQTSLDPPVLTEFKLGSAVLAGRSIPFPGKAVTYDVAGDDACQEKFPKANEQSDSLRGDFTIRLAKPLGEGKIYVCQTVEGSEAARVSPKYTVSDTNAYWINIEQERPIREGTEKISGSVGEAVKAVRIMVYSPTFAPGPGAEGSAKSFVETDIEVSELGTAFYNKLMHFVEEKGQAPANGREYLARAVECALGDLEQVMDVPVSKGRFESAFKRPIDAGQCIVVRASSEDGKIRSEGPDVEFVHPAFADWGRMRGIFTVGTTLGNSRGATEAAPYIGFYADANAGSHLLQRESARKANNNAAPKMFELKKRTWAFHVFSEARLTQAGRADVTDPAAQTQALFFQFGTYFPLRLAGMDWRHKGRLFSFFVAPVAKYGSLWLKEGVVTRETTREIPADVGRLTGQPVAASSSTSPVVNKGAHPFYGYGARFGFFRYDLIGKVIRNRQVAPELIGYLDLTYGQNSSFRTPFTFSSQTDANQITRTVTGYRTDPRYQMEGRLKLPALPVQIGVDLNVNASRPDRSATEFRFIVAFRVDAARAIGRALGSK